MRIALDGSALGHPETGVGRYTVELIRGLAALDHADDLTVLFNRRSGDVASGLLPAAVRTVNPRWPTRALRPAWERLGWPPAERFVGAADVFHASDWIHPPLRRAAMVATVHDVAPLRHPEWYAPDVVARHRAVHASLLRRDVRIVTVSAFTRDALLELGGLDEDRVEAVPSGVSADFRPVEEAADVAARHGLDRPYLLYVGSRERRKNVLGLLDAFGRLAGEHPDLLLALVGMRPRVEGRAIHGADAWIGDAFEDRVAALGLADRVRVLGSVPRADLPGLYGAAAAFVFPTLYEGFGLPVLEAMACGTPVVASDRTAVPEVAGDAAVLVDPTDPEALADGVAEVLSSEAARARLVAAGRARAAAFTWTRTAEGTRAAYERAVDDRKG